MNRQEKEIVVKTLKEQFEANHTTFVVDYKGLSVEQVRNLKKQLKSSGSNITVSKARLMKIAVKDSEDVVLDPYFKGQIALVFSRENETPAVAKVLVNFAKENEAFKLVAGSLDSKLVDKASISVLASLPSREVLLGQLCGTLQAPIAKFNLVLNLMIMRLLFVLKKIEEQKS